MTDYDVIIIGTGAGGGTLARHLAPSGKRVLLLERGDWLPREPENWSTADVFVDGRYISPDTWYDEKGKTFQPQVHYFVGGATKLYGAALYRLRERDFGELQHHDGISPAWPISYSDMEPFYTQAELLYQVRGARAEDPTEPPASADYPFPALPHEPRIQHDNRVTLEKDGNVKLAYTANNQESGKRLYHELRSMLGYLGMHPDHLIPRNAYLKTTIPVAGCAHQAGTCRFGNDPATSVLDANCKAHEVDNLYVVDTSFFPSIGAVNPALTAMANALRVGDHLLERLG